MSGLPWFRCHVRDLKDGLLGLTREERGTYITILTLIYERAGPIPDDDSWIASQLWCSVRAWKKDRASLLAKSKLFEVNYNGTPSLMNRRAADEIAHMELVSGVRSEAGKKGGSKKPPKPDTKPNEINDNAQANASQLPEQMLSKSEADKRLEDSSVASPNGEPTGGEPPQTASQKAWTDAKVLLVAQGAMTMDAAGKFFGKLLSQNGLDAADLLGAIGEATASGTLDPQGYLTAAAKARGRRKQATGPPKRVGFV